MFSKGNCFFKENGCDDSYLVVIFQFCKLFIFLRILYMYCESSGNALLNYVMLVMVVVVVV